MTGTKIQARFERFATHFLLPVVNGGDVVVGPPVTPGMLETFVLARPTDPDTRERFGLALRGSAASIAPIETVGWPRGGVIAVAMAAHNLLMVTDPRFIRWGSRRSRRLILDWVDWFLQEAGAPKTRDDALGRHAFVGRLLQLSRRDITAHNWAFTHQYFGRDLPTGFLTKPRWVDIDNRERRFREIFETVDKEVHASLRVTMLLARTPLTQLLECTRVPQFDFTGAMLSLLADHVLRSGAARALTETGRTTMAPLGAALRRLIQPEVESRHLRPALSLIVEMHLIAILDARAAAEPVWSEPGSGDEAFFCAVLPATLSTTVNFAHQFSAVDQIALERWASKLARAVDRDVVTLLAKHAVAANAPAGATSPTIKRDSAMKAVSTEEAG